MKQIFVSLVPLLLLSASALAAPTTFSKIEFFGLNCTVCEDGLKEKFEKLPAVLHVNIDMPKFLVCVQHKPGRALKGSDIRETLSSAGFTTVKVELADRC